VLLVMSTLMVGAGWSQEGILGHIHQGSMATRVPGPVCRVSLHHTQGGTMRNMPLTPMGRKLHTQHASLTLMGGERYTHPACLTHPWEESYQHPACLLPTFGTFLLKTGLKPVGRGSPLPRQKREEHSLPDSPNPGITPFDQECGIQAGISPG